MSSDPTHPFRSWPPSYAIPWALWWPLLFIVFCAFPVMLAFPIAGLCGVNLTVHHLLAAVGILVIGVVALWRSVTGSLRRRGERVRAAHGAICPTCGYDLSGREGDGACPECGRFFDRARDVARWRQLVRF